MNLYKLESKSIDEDFLNGIPIECIAMISVQDYHAGLIKEGDKIVVMLSNGKKYMGKVTGFTFSSDDKNAFVGVLGIIKYEPS